MPEGKIMKALSGFYYVKNDQGTFQCRGRGLFRKQKITPLVGDNVIFEADNQTDGYIIEMLPRRNHLIRPPVANIDQAIIVVSAKRPNFSTILLDRFLTLAEANELVPIILVTKIDLLTEEEQEKIDQFVNTYRSIGYRVITLSTMREMDLSPIYDQLTKKISVVAGQSGVGKSSFLNTLNPDLQIKTDEISDSLGRGKHTTRHVELVQVADGLVADTPGFSSLDFDQIAREQLSHCFKEFTELQSSCKFRGCVHINEPKCAVKEAVEQNNIADFRYDHYLQFYQEIQSRKPRY